MGSYKRHVLGYFFVFLFPVLLLIAPDLLHASNFNWVQNDWSGGTDTAAVAIHPGNQSGWNRFYSKDNYIDTATPGQVILSLQPPVSLSQTGDVQDLDRGTLTNLLLIGTGTYVSTKYDEKSSSVSKSGTWTTSAYDSLSYNGYYIYSTATGAYVTFSFSGTGVSWIGLKGFNFGIANVYIDGVFQGSVDLYSSSNQWQQVLWSTTALTNTTHTLKIEVSGTRNPASGTNAIGVDAFETVVPNSDPGAYLTFVDGSRSFTQTGDILDFDRGTLTNLLLMGSGTYVSTPYDETSPSVSKSGTWVTSPFDSRSYNGYYIYSATTGDTVTFSFSGTGVSWIGLKGFNLGFANVYLDGVLQGSVDLYNSTTLYQQVLWSASGLTNSAHTLKVEVSGKKNINSGNYYISADAFVAVVPNPDTAAYLTLASGATSGDYVSPSVDAGPGGATFSSFSISWSPTTVPAGTYLRFQIAANDDNQTWNFVGPDGLPGTYYVTSGTPIYSGHNGKRYFKYKAFFYRPTAADASPFLDSITIGYGLVPLLYGEYESSSIDFGLGGVFYFSISGNSAIPAGASIKFQIATNDDNQTWNFIGPGGSPGTYYETSGIPPIYSGHNGKRYFKYKAFFYRPSFDPMYNDPVNNPVRLNDVTISYSVYASGRGLVSTPYNTTDPTNVINRLKWLENAPPGTDIILQIRTSQDGITWGPWLGPRNTTFSSSSGVLQVTVQSTAGFSVGSQITLTDSSDISGGLDSGLSKARMENKKIIAIDPNTSVITLDSQTSRAYAAGSILSDTYTDSAGTEPVNPLHKNGNDDRWLQYRVFLFTSGGTTTPYLYENRIGYFKKSAVYQPDGIIEDGTIGGNGNNTYGASGSGAGGSYSKDTDPGFKSLQPVTFDIRVQNDGNTDSVDDSFVIKWDTPSDVSGNWTVYLCDVAGDPGCVNDLTSPVSVPLLNTGSEKAYTVKVTPSLYAPGDSSKDIILNIFSENDYSMTDSVKATTRIRRAYQADGLIAVKGDLPDGDNRIDPCNPACTGSGGQSQLKDAGPGDTIEYTLTLQNEGNVADTYAISLITPPPSGWVVLINDGLVDYDITNMTNVFTTYAIPPPPDISTTVTYTVKIVPKGEPSARNIILGIRSNGAGAYIEAVIARINLKGVYKVDGIIYGLGYDAGGNFTDGGVMGSGCGTAVSGDNIYGALSSGDGGCAALDIPAGSFREITVGIQNEGNLVDKYQISWNTPANWTVRLQENQTLSSPITVPDNLSGIPPASGKCTDNSACFNPGDVAFFVFKITTPASFTSGARTINFEINSINSSFTKYDSVKAVVNSGDTVPPASVTLSLSAITDTSVKVSWTAPGDNGNSGTAKSYDLRYSTASITNANFDQAKRVSGCKSGETVLRQPNRAGSAESCTVSQLFANTDYYFALKTTDDSGNVSSISACTACPAHTGSSTDITAPEAVSDLNAFYTRVVHPMDNPAFTATTHTVSLRWTAKADDGATASSGPATAYDLRYSARKIAGDGAVLGAGDINFSSAKPVNALFRYDTQGIVPVCLDGVTDLAQLDQAFIANPGELLPPKSSGGAECYTVIVEDKINTGGNIIDDRTQNTRFYFAVKTLDERGRESSANISPISNIAGAMTRLIPNAYNMVSVPYIPNPNTPADVFGDDVGTPLYTYQWDARGPNSDSGCYNGEPAPDNREILNDGAGDDDGVCDAGEACYICSRLTSIKEGLGHFLWVPYGNYTLDVPSFSSPSSSSASYSPSCDDGTGVTFPCYIFSLQDGWNMIGNTFDKEINLSNRDINGNGTVESNERGIYVRKTGGGGGVSTFQTAATANNWIDNDIFTYNGVNYTYEICDQDQGIVPLGTKCPVVIQPWKSYWIRVPGSAGSTFDLLIPE